MTIASILYSSKNPSTVDRVIGHPKNHNAFRDIRENKPVLINKDLITCCFIKTADELITPGNLVGD